MFKITIVRYSKVVLPSLLAPLFGLLFVFLSWALFGIKKFPDIDNYLAQIDPILIGVYTDIDGFDLLEVMVSEPLWRYAMLFIGLFFDESINGFLLISFFCITTYAYFLFGRVNIFLASFFLLNPLVIDLVMSQIRSALAIALCLVALMIKKRSFGLILIVIAGLIHTAIFIIPVVYIFAKLLERVQSKFDYKLCGLFAICLGLAIAVLLSSGREIILGLVGDRRAEYDVEASSILYLGYWMLLALALLFARDRNRFADGWSSYFSIVILSMPFFMGILSTNGSRFLALGFPVVLYSMVTRVSPTREVLIGSLFFYQLVQYVYWFPE